MSSTQVRTLTLLDRRDVEQAATTATWLRRPWLDHVSIEFEVPDVAATQRRLRRLFNDCGCAWGELALILALLVTLLAGVPWQGVVVAAAAAAAVGKLTGLTWSHHRLHQLLRGLAAAADAHEGGGRDGR